MSRRQPNSCFHIQKRSLPLPQAERASLSDTYSSIPNMSDIEEENQRYEQEERLAHEPEEPEEDEEEEEEEEDEEEDEEEEGSVSTNWTKCIAGKLS